MREWWRRNLARGLAGLRSGGRAAVLWSLRITVAAVASYVVATLFFPGTQPLLAPLTAMLVVQVTPISLLTRGVDRVVAVVSGVSLAVVFASVVPLQWWSLGLLILIAITVGQALRLSANLIEVAISGMLVLGVGSLGAEAAAWQRVAETLVGAAVGIAANLLFPPKVASGDAGQAIDRLADSISEVLNRAADQLSDLVADRSDLAPSAWHWLGEARRVTHDIPNVGAALLHAEQGRRFNVRAVGTPNVTPGLRQGLEALEHSAIAVRGMFRALADTAEDGPDLEDEATEAVFRGLVQTFREMAAGVDAFGHLVRSEAEPEAGLSSAEVDEVREALEGLRGARSRLEEALDARVEPGLLELHAAVLSAVKRLLTELDLDERMRRQLRIGRPRPRASRARARQARRGTERRRPGGSAEAPPEGASEAETQLLPTDEAQRRSRRRD